MFNRILTSRTGRLIALVFLLASLILPIFLQSPSAQAGTTSWEQIIRPLGNGFESTYKGNWVKIHTQNTVYCSTDSNNVIYTRTRYPPHTDDKDWARWRPNIPSTGEYDVYVYIPNYSHDSSITTRARYRIHHANGDTTVTVDQNQHKCSWYHLGRFRFNAGTSGYVYMGDYTGDDPWRLIAADGMKFVQVPPPPTPTPTPPPPTPTPTPTPEPTPTYNTPWLTDEMMTGEYDTSVERIRYFFQRYHSCLTNPIQDVDGVTIDIPQLIHDAAVQYHINPKVLLATMQKEQSAILGCPQPARLRQLMGLPPSTAREQISGAASLFRAYMDEIATNGQTRSGWRVGVAKMTQDGVSVTPATAAVAAQFTYTPYAGDNWGGNRGKGGVWLFWNAWYNQFHFDQPLPAPPPPPTPEPECHVPYYSQLDSRWRNHPLRTRGQCSHYCGTIGHCGCTLTSATMLFRFYGASRNPASLSDCMGVYACPFYWGVGRRCSQGKAGNNHVYGFSWWRLNQQINTYHRPVLLAMYKYIHGRRHTHWVLVYRGSGSNPSNYRIHDPGYLHGQGKRLSSRTNTGWHPYKIVTYDGHPICQNPTTPDPLAMNIAPPPASLPSGTTALTAPSATALTADEVITADLWLYEATEVTMTVQIQAFGSESNVADMKVWVGDTDPATLDWQPVQLFAVLPLTDEVHALFRTELGTVSQPITTTDYAETEIAEPMGSLFLPLVLKGQ